MIAKPFQKIELNGSVGDSYIRTNKPREKQDSYIKKKYYFSIEVQEEVKYKKKIVDAIIGAPGSVHYERDNMNQMGNVISNNVDADIISTYQNISAGKEFGQKTFRSLRKRLGKLWNRHRGNASITEYDPCYKVAYLGNVLTGWAKGEGCVEKPVSTLWRNYVNNSKPDVLMRLTVTHGGLTAATKDHGLTEYWAHRVTYCTAPTSHPRLFVWVYRHEGRRLRPELRCHAALCSKESTAGRLATTLNARLHQALLEFRRDKISKQNARLSLVNAVYENPSLPRRKILLSTGGHNYRPPLERSKSAPKLFAIEEDTIAEEIEQNRLIEELKSLNCVAQQWQHQDMLRLANLLDELNRGSSDEKSYFPSDCETASTTNMNDKAYSFEESHFTYESESKNKRRSTFGDDVLRINKVLPKRNSEDPQQLTGNLNTTDINKKLTNRRHFSSMINDEKEKLDEKEITQQNSSLFEYDEVKDFEEIVDYRPRGESLNKTKNFEKRKPEFEIFPVSTYKKLQGVENTFFMLESLDEEADSDESGYVEAPPKSLIKQSDDKHRKSAIREKEFFDLIQIYGSKYVNNDSKCAIEIWKDVEIQNPGITKVINRYL